MESKNPSVREAFPFIRQILQDAYKVDAHLFTHPYGDTGIIDRGFRKMLWGKIAMPNIFSEYLENEPEYQMAVVKSSLGYYNLLAAVSLDRHHPDFITIGPFSDTRITDAFIHRIIDDQHLTPAQAQLAGKFYEILPIADSNDVTILAQHLLAAYIPEYADIKVIYLNYSEATHEILPDQTAFANFSTAAAEKYTLYLHDFLDALVSGNSTQANKKLKIFLDATGIENPVSFSRQKRLIQELNSFCKEKLLSTQIHPYYTLRLADSLAVQTERCTDPVQLSKLPYQFVRKYCLLVQNYSLAGCSQLIRSVIAYIDQNLEEDLSLAGIAAHFHKNASGLSAQFSKETGCCLTDYIHHARIQAALPLFLRTDLPVAEIASRVGIYNSRYFTRLFREQIGMSPSEYRKTLVSKIR